MDYYFLTTYYTQPKNKKQIEVVDYCKRFDNILTVNKCAIDAMHAELKLLCDKLNEKFPKSREINLAQNSHTGSVSIKEVDTYYEVFRINATKVRGTYEFSEKIQNKLSNKQNLELQ